MDLCLKKKKTVGEKSTIQSGHAADITMFYSDKEKKNYFLSLFGDLTCCLGKEKLFFHLNCVNLSKSQQNLQIIMSLAVPKTAYCFNIHTEWRMFQIYTIRFYALDTFLDVN